MPPRDFVVVLPGILGSTLRQSGHLVWAPSAGVALRAIATFGASLKRLQLPAGIGDDHPGDGVEPVDLMPDLHVVPGIWTPVKGYERLLAKLQSLGYRQSGKAPESPAGNLLPVAYDWRLSCRYNGQRLAKIIEPALERWRAQGGAYADAQVVFVCHSMGGLVARWYVEQCGGAETTRKLITLGTPFRGSARALGQLINGAPYGLGRFQLDLTGFARSMPSLHQLLPEYACLSGAGGLTKITDATLPELDTAMVADAMNFHDVLKNAEANRPKSLTATHVIIGTNQPTATTAQIANGRVELINDYEGEDLYGDSTVPIVAACRFDVAMDSNTIRRVPDKHGNLQCNTAVLDEIEGIITASPIIVKAAKPIMLRVGIPDFALSGVGITVQVTTNEPTRHALYLLVRSEAGAIVESRRLRMSSGAVATELEGLAPGAYTIDVTGSDPTSPFAPVSSDLLVWERPDIGTYLLHG